MAILPAQAQLTPAGNGGGAASDTSYADNKAADPARVFQRGQDAHEAAVNGLHGNTGERTGRSASD